MKELFKKFKIVVGGNSIGDKLAAECKGPGGTVQSLTVSGWRLNP
jgi:hypothetical protein